ncbi:hypothetical protein VTP01DRAFT_8720 [Rhizomucor pusillus]|uniref:uncharacterized protein n=1 Tax=Rhizomucor pusillus TaxID=4840 RepID=UPI003743F454
MTLTSTDTKADLCLVTATQLLQAQADGTQDDTLNALKLLRREATAERNVEAKIKLCTIFSATSRGRLEADAREVELWSRSVFDRQLSDALHDSARDIEAAPTTAKSTVDYILENAQSNDSASKNLAYLAGLLLTRGIGVARNIDHGLQILERAAAEEHAYASYELGRIYGDYYNYSLHDTPRSISWFEKAAELGCTRAHIDLAVALQGHDDAKAINFATLGAEKANDRYCQYILSKHCDNQEERLRWLQLSADQGFALAIEELVGHYMEVRSYADAIRLCSSASAADLPSCQIAMADIHRYGLQVPQDHKKAFQYYQTAANHPESPNQYAQHMLGEMFLNGEGIPQDTAVAKEWYQIAATQGYEPSRRRLQQLTVSVPTPRSSADTVESDAGAGVPNKDQQQKKQNRWSMGFFGRKK